MKVAETSFFSVTETSTFVDVILCHMQIKKTELCISVLAKLTVYLPVCVHKCARSVRYLMRCFWKKYRKSKLRFVIQKTTHALPGCHSSFTAEFHE